MPSPDRAAARLRADEIVAGRAFSDPVHSAGDCATLAVLRAALRRAGAGSQAPVLRFADETGEHHVVVPDWAGLAAARRTAIVGFFGQARDDVDHARISALEHEIVARAAACPGRLAYHNARLASGQWGNLVVFGSQSATAGVTGDPVHAAAVARTPHHYRSLRLHRGSLADGGLGSAQPALHETLYLDFGETPPWRALRAYA
jgi:hypothetical protein